MDALRASFMRVSACLVWGAVCVAVSVACLVTSQGVQAATASDAAAVASQRSSVQPSVHLASNAQSKVQPSIQSAEPVRVGIDLWPGYYPIVLAKKLGYFQQQGLDVQFVLPEATDDMLGQFVKGKLDMVCVAMGDAFSLYKQDPKLRVVMITDESSGGDALLAKADVTNFAGRTIGTNLNGFGELFVDGFLTRHGLTRDQVTLVHQEAADALTFLRDGKADVVHTWEPYVTEIVSFGIGKPVFDSADTPGLIPDALLVNGQFRHGHPQRVQKFVAAWLQAAQWWKANREAGDQLIEPELLLMPGSVNLKGVRLYDAAQNHLTFTRGDDMQSLYHVTQRYIDFFVKKGVLKAGMQPDDILDPSFLPKLSP